MAKAKLSWWKTKGRGNASGWRVAHPQRIQTARHRTNNLNHRGTETQRFLPATLRASLSLWFSPVLFEGRAQCAQDGRGRGLHAGFATSMEARFRCSRGLCPGNSSPRIMLAAHCNAALPNSNALRMLAENRERIPPGNGPGRRRLGPPLELRRTGRAE